jgi:hypothetical protein
MSKSLTTTNAVPDYLKGGKTAKMGNVDHTDQIIPRVKLIQATSPEITEFDAAKVGHFWHTVGSESLGQTIRGVPILIRKSYVLWTPRNDERGILARANDGVNWDNAGMTFTVKPKNSPHEVTYKLGKTVNESVDGAIPLTEFGSSIPGDPNSPPAAALTYQCLWYFPDFPDFSPSVIINTRSSVKAAKSLISKIDIRPVDHFAGVYNINAVADKGPDGPFFNFSYSAAGYVDEDTYSITKQLHDKFKVADWSPSDENEEQSDVMSGGAATSDKF